MRHSSPGQTLAVHAGFKQAVCQANCAKRIRLQEFYSSSLLSLNDFLSYDTVLKKARILPLPMSG